MVFNNSTWRDIYFGWSGSGAQYLVQSETRNWSTGSYSFNASVTSFTPQVDTWIYFKLQFDGTNLIFYWSYTGVESDYTQVAAQAVSSWIGSVTHIGIGDSPSGPMDWFRRTA
jgi:hypothetical protein